MIYMRDSGVTLRLEESSVRDLVENARLPCLRTPPHPPARWLTRLRPLLLTPERSLQPHGGLPWA